VRVRRGVLGALLALAVFASTPAFATSLTTKSKAVQGGRTAVSSCLSNTPSFTYTQNGTGNSATITAVNVSNLNSGCNTGILRITFVKADGTDLVHGSATVTSGAANVTTLSSNPVTVNVAKVVFVIEGP